MLNFRTPTIRDRVRQTLDQALAAQLEHSTAAEHHDALARMYDARVKRLRKDLESLPTATAQ